jgi:hypothetical protein
MPRMPGNSHRAPAFAEADGRPGGEAGREAEHPLFPARDGEPADVQRADGVFPVDGGSPGAVVDEAGEVVAGARSRGR